MPSVWTRRGRPKALAPTFAEIVVQRCRNGHPRTDDNLLPKVDGYAECRTCRRNNRREQRKKRVDTST